MSGLPARKLAASIALAAVILGAAGFSWLWFAAGKEEARLALGRSLYGTHCASCHGAKLEGQPDWQEPRPDGRMPAPPHDASGHTWHHSDQALFLITKKGLGAVVPDYESDMPAFEGVLADTEIQAILDFIKSNWPEREREYQEARSRAE